MDRSTKHFVTVTAGYLLEQRPTAIELEGRAEYPLTIERDEKHGSILVECEPLGGRPVRETFDETDPVRVSFNPNDAL